MNRQAKVDKHLNIYGIVKKHFIFFDMEVLEDYYSFTYSKYQEEPITLINPTREQLLPIIESKVLVGYNCNNYDALILYTLLFASNPTSQLLRKVSDNIIQSNMVYIKNFINRNPQFKTFVNGVHREVRLRFVDLIEGDNRYSLKDLDLYFNNNRQVFDFNHYKTIKMIKEDDKLKLWEEYEINDVKLLSQLFKEKEYKTFGVSYYDLLVLYHDYIYIEGNENIYFLGNIVNQVVSYLFFTKEPNKPVIDNMDSLIDELTEKNNKLINELKKLQPELLFQEEDSNKGGINYVRLGKHRGNIVDLDITSMYPNIMLLHESKLSNFIASSFKEVLEKRVELKHNSPRDYRVQAYKIALNSTFGNLVYKDENKELAIQLITKSGQHEILSLAIKLINKYNCEILQIATDGILAKYPDNMNPYALLCYAKENSKLPIEETTEYNRVYISAKNSYVAINDKDNIYKGKGLFKLKDKLNTILPKRYNRYYPNWLLAKAFDIKLPVVDYIQNGIKGKIYGCSNDGLSPKMFQGRQYATKLNKELCIPSDIMAKYLMNEVFLSIPKEFQTLVDNGFIKNIVRVVNDVVTHVGNEAIINHKVDRENSNLAVKPDNNLMICIYESGNGYDSLFIDKRNIKWLSVNRARRDRELSVRIMAYLHIYHIINVKYIELHYGIVKDRWFIPNTNIVKLEDIIKDKEGLYEVECL